MSPTDPAEHDATTCDDWNGSSCCVQARNYTTSPILHFHKGDFKTQYTMQSFTKTATRTIRPSFLHRRPFSCLRRRQSQWTPQPSPPKLPKEEQEIFERLQAQSTGAFSQPKPLQETAANRDAEAEAQVESMEGEQPRSERAEDMLEQLRERARVVAKGEGEELHPNVRRGAKPEFEGDTNPVTGEVGGPKNDPLRWKGDWSYNGRVTDF